MYLPHGYSIEHVSHPHPRTRMAYDLFTDKLVPEEGGNYRYTHAVLVRFKGRIVGQHSYVAYRRYESSFTWVARKHQRQGLALAMWAEGFRQHPYKRVRVIAITDAGCRLIATLQREFPGKSWEFFDDREM